MRSKFSKVALIVVFEFALCFAQEEEVPMTELPVPVVVQKQCERMYNINELLFKIKDSFPRKLKDCSSELAKDMVTPASLGGRNLEPKSFMTQCAVGGVKKELPDGFPGTDKIVGSLENFVQGILNTAIVGGTLDPKKLVSAVGSMNILNLLDDVKKLDAGTCVVNEPYDPPIAREDFPNIVENSSGEKKEKNIASFGIRAGLNNSATYAKNPNDFHNSIGGMQVGFVIDFAPISWLHIQPGLMYIEKGYVEGNDSKNETRNLELPLLLSFKLAALRLNYGLYFNYNVGHDSDIGYSTGVGLDIGMFYIGAFYNHGLTETEIDNYRFYYRTVGFNVGINL